MDKLNFKKHLIVNLLLNITLTLLITLIIFILYSGIEFLFIFLSLIPGILIYIFLKTNLILSFDLISIYVIQYFIYFIFFIFIHKYLFKRYIYKIGYIFTIIFTIINSILGFISIFEMMQ